jgi:hypothetical protein
MDGGAFIMHRCCGISSDVAVDDAGDGVGRRAVTKMKAVITQRFELEGGEVDVEADCRFAFFWEKEGEDEREGDGRDERREGDRMRKGEWRARFVRHWYEKVSWPLIVNLRCRGCDKRTVADMWCMKCRIR